MSFLICKKKKLFLANTGKKINKIEKKYCWLFPCCCYSCCYFFSFVFAFLLDEMWFNFNKINF